MIKKTVFFALAALSLALGGCLKPGDSAQTFTYVRAIVNVEANMQYSLSTAFWGKVLAPELVHFSELYDGDAVLAHFTLNYEQQADEDYLTVTEIEIIKLDTAHANESPEGASFTDDFIAPISAMEVLDVIECRYGRTLLFIAFNVTARTNQIIDFEMTYDPHDPRNIPSVYIRARASGQSNQAIDTVVEIAAFDITHLLVNIDNSENTFLFNIEHNIGGENDTEVFRHWIGNPLELQK